MNVDNLIPPAKLLKRIVILFVLTLVTLGGQAKAKDIKAYVFGNSLIHHDSDQTSAMHWAHFIADAAGDTFGVDGQWGFLRNFSADLPPTANWSFKDVKGVWNPEKIEFGDVGFDAVVINAPNFIQGTAPDISGEWVNPTGRTPLQDTLVVADWIAAQSDGEKETPRFFLYEGWPEMDGLIEKDTPVQGFQSYYHRAGQEYHEWYLEWVRMMREARPNYDVTLIPVAKILSQLLSNGPLAEIAPRDLYIDDAPHGTATLYFLAGAIVFSALYEAELPNNLSVPDEIDAVVRENIEHINRVIQKEISKDHAAVHNIQYVQADVVAGVGVGDPSLAMGLNGIADWSTQHPFIDLMKTGRPWVGHEPNKWGAVSAAELEEAGILDSDGWPMSVPKGLTALETFILTDQPKTAKSLAGWYVLTYKGNGIIRLNGRAKKARAKTGKIRFRYSPGDGPVGISIVKTDIKGTGDYIRNIKVVREEHLELAEVGALFNPDWVEKIADLRTVRFMDWMSTNGSQSVDWSDRPVVSDYTYVRRGVPAEVMIALSNQISTDPWFNMPHMANDLYFQRFGALVRATLDPELNAYVEYSNELWNFTFPQAHWAVEQANERWGQDSAPDAWLQYSGLRAAEMARIWKGIFSDDPERLKTVIATHTGWPGLEEGLLGAPLYLEENGENQPPVTAFDAYAVTGYFGLELGEEEVAPTVLQWIEKARKSAEEEGKSKGYQRVKLRVFIEENQYSGAIERAIDKVRKGSLKEYLTEALPYQAKVAEVNGMQLLMYEGGTHVVGLGALSGNDMLTGFFNALNYTPEMAELYEELLAGWREAGGTLFNAFVDVSAPSQYGSWGSLRHLDDDNPRHNTLVSFNKNNGSWWEKRPASTFLNGKTFVGSKVKDVMKGTAKRDIFLGRGGNDRIVVMGRGDLVHGGEGNDVAVLPGALEDYGFSQIGALLIAQSDEVAAQMFAVEVLEFTTGTTKSLTVSDLQ